MATISVKVKMPDGNTVTKTFDPDNPGAGITRVKCSNCESGVVMPGVRVFRMSGIMLGSPNDVYIKHPTLFCPICGKVLPEKP